MAGSVDLRDFKVEKFVREFSRELAVAQRRAGRKIGPKVVKQFKAGLGAVDPKRKEKVYFKVWKNGTFAAVDNGIDARRRELGKIIRPVTAGVSAIRVNFGKAERDTKATGAVKVGDKMFLVGKPHGESKPRLIAILKRKVIMKPVAEPLRLRTIVKNHFPAYLEEMSKHLGLGGFNAG